MSHAEPRPLTQPEEQAACLSPRCRAPGAPTQRALSGVRVLDLTDERAIYGTKLLADLGADVVRPEPPTGDPLRQRGPRLRPGERPGSSLWHTFFASSRRTAILDPTTAGGASQLAALVAETDVVLCCAGAFGVDAAQLAAAQARQPALIVVEASSFGPDGPWRDYLAPDLVAGALGGAVATTGDADTPPLKTFGELNFVLSGAYLAIAALSALYQRRTVGAGDRAQLSVHQCIASCLEHVLMWYWHHDAMPGADGPVLPRRGSLHWTNAYVVMPAKGGSVMVTPTPNIDNQLVWLVEQDAHEDLLDPKYQEPERRAAFIRRMMAVLRRWVATQDAETLFFEAQRRHSPYGWVQPVDKVASNPQLAARDWWRSYAVDDATVRGPGPPYRFSATPWHAAAPSSGGFRPRPAPAGVAGAAPAPLPPSQAGDAGGPLAGVKVLDFTHVLAGPFATRILADLGADVVKVNSEARARANAPSSIYYALWNRSKRALALDMAQDESRAICRRLAAVADVVIDNFSVGVLERWGIGYDAVAAANAKVIYLQMSGMGQCGPWSDFVTYAPTIHALAGLTYLTGEPGRQDIGIGFSYNDHCAGLHGAVAILAALEARRHLGRGQRIDLSQFEVGVNLLGPTLLDYFANGRVAEPCGNRLPYDAAAPHGCYRCRGPAEATEDERWLAIACMTDAHWQGLRKAMGEPPWSDAAALATAAGRLADAQLDANIEGWTRTLSAEEAMRRCQAAGVPAGVVQTGADLGNDPQLRHDDFLVAMDEPHSTLGPMFADRLPIRFRTASTDRYRPTRGIGEDNAAVLGDWLGMSAEEVARGEAAGHLR